MDIIILCSLLVTYFTYLTFIYISLPTLKHESILLEVTISEGKCFISISNIVYFYLLIVDSRFFLSYYINVRLWVYLLCLFSVQLFFVVGFVFVFIFLFRWFICL